MAARRVLVTGAASGIGRETAHELARRGDHVIVADRNVEGGEAVAERIRNDGGSAEFRELDLSDLARSRDFARRLSLGVLMATAAKAPKVVVAGDRSGFEFQ